MQVSEVKESDMRMLGQLVNMLQVGTYSLSGKDLCASADTIRWLQRFATEAAKSFSDSKTSEVGPVKGAEPPSQFGEGVTLKSYSPGKVGKK